MFRLFHFGTLAGILLLAAASFANAIVLAPQKPVAPQTNEAGEETEDGQEYYPRSAFGVPPEDPERLDIERDRKFRDQAQVQTHARRPAGLVRQEADIQALATPKATPANPLQDLIFDAKNASQEVSVIATDLGFKPKTIFASRDVPLKLFVTGASAGTLCFMLDQFRVKRQIRTNKVEATPRCTSGDLIPLPSSLNRFSFLN